MTSGVPPAANVQHLRPWHLIALAAPLLWLVPAILHPNDAGRLFQGISDEANMWIFVHVAQLVLTPSSRRESGCC